MTRVAYPPPPFGWASYADTQYSSGSPLTMVTDVPVVMPNNAGAIIDTQKPSDIASYYTANKITGRNGDSVLIAIDLIGRPTTASATWLDLYLDIGGSIGIFYRTTQQFPKGNGQAQNILFNIPAYQGTTWEANGATVYGVANHGLEIWGVRYVVHRLHRGHP